MVETIAKGHHVSIGISNECGWDNVQAAKEEARIAGVLANSHHTHLEYYGASVPSDGITQELISVDGTVAASIAIILDRASPDLKPTLLAWLSKLGNTEQTALALGIHRHTLAKRLQEAEDLLHVSLGDARTRAQLLLALTVNRPE